MNAYNSFIKCSLSSTNVLEYPPYKKTIDFIVGGILAYVSGCWFLKAAGIVQHWISKLWRYENGSIKFGIGRMIGNGLRKARDCLLRQI
jgi:hypothetical protein